MLSNLLENGEKCIEKCNFCIKYFGKIKCYAHRPYLVFSELKPGTHIWFFLCLSLVSCNIEGVKANTLYLQKLCKDNEIVCLQEHWLWDFEKHWFRNEIPNFGSFVRCCDFNDIISSFSIPRGRAGVAILWNETLTDSISRLQVGNERVIAIEINCSIKLCIIIVYLPTNKLGSEYGYREWIQRIILCVDLNGSLLSSRNNKHDIILKDFVKNHCLSSGVLLVTSLHFIILMELLLLKLTMCYPQSLNSVLHMTFWIESPWMCQHLGPS